MQNLLSQGADRAGGWKTHFERTKRWEQRALKALTDLPSVDFHEALDFALAYFVWCHSLRDWLIKDGAISKNELDDSLKQHPEWKIVRDLANRSRHLVLTQSPTDGEWAVFREYEPFALQVEGRERHHLNLLFDGEKHRVSDLVSRSSRMWDDVLFRGGLLPV